MNYKKMIIGILWGVVATTTQLSRAGEIAAIETITKALAKEANLEEKAAQAAVNNALGHMGTGLGMDARALEEAMYGEVGAEGKAFQKSLRTAFEETIMKEPKTLFKAEVTAEKGLVTVSKFDSTAFNTNFKSVLEKDATFAKEFHAKYPDALKTFKIELPQIFGGKAALTQTNANMNFTESGPRRSDMDLEVKLQDASTTLKEYEGHLDDIKSLKADQKRMQALKEKSGTKGLTDAELKEYNELKMKPDFDTEIFNATEKMKTLEKRLIENDQLPFKYSYKIKAKSLAAALNPAALLHTVVMGLVFGFSGMIQSSFEQLMQGHAAWETMSVPQKFGGIWMQIPRSLLSEAGKPLSYFPLYVALNRAPSDKSNKREDNADTDAYAQNASLFVSRDDYDNWAKSAIPSGDFPGRMVELRTGAHLIGSGALVPGNESIQLIGEVAGQRGSSTVNLRLNDVAGGVAGGVSKQEYEEYLIKQSGYTGSSVLANLCNVGQNEAMLKKMYPDLPADHRYPALLNASVQTLMNGTSFGVFAVKGFQALDKEEAQKLGVTAAENKPYVPMGIFIYQTADTPFAQSVHAVAAKNPTYAPLLDAFTDYVLVLDDSHQPTHLQLPLPAAPYNFPTWTLNPNVKSMLSLLDGTLYTKDGQAKPSGIAIDDALKNYPSDVVAQITNMRDVMVKQVKNGPFIVGAKTLTIDPALAKKGVYVYELAHGLENGGTDYLVATTQLQVMQLPGTPDYFVSLVSSRLYDSHLVLYNEKNGGYPDYEYTVYKQKDDSKPPLVILGSPNDQYGKPVVQGLRAPLGTVFVGYDLNPNTIQRTDVSGVDQETLQWLAQEVGAWHNNSISWPLPIPSPLQWALSERGPQVKGADENSPVARIGDVIAKQAPALRKKIDAAYTAWKQYANQKGGAASIARQLETYVWAPGTLHSIVLQATGADDIKQGNYVYTSGTFPGEYFVMSADKKGVQEIGQQFDPENPQPYIISLSTGSVYGRAEKGELVGAVNPDELTLKPALSSALAKQIDESKGGAAIQSKRTPVKTFGPYSLYLFDEDARRKQYVYADVTGIKNPTSMDQAQLFNQITNLFVAIEPKAGTKEDAKTDPTNWVYGKQISANTINVLNITNGNLFSRGGTSLGFFKDYTQAASANMDLQGGYLDHVLAYLATTWGQEKTETTLRPAMKDKIVALTKARYDALISQSEEVRRVAREEKVLRQPLDANTRANINSASFVQSLYGQAPRRFVKMSGGKYYLLGYADGFQDAPTQLASITDFNVGDGSKDNKRGAVYDAAGNCVMPNVNGLTLDALRASIGLTVGADGSQKLGIPVFQPTMIMDVGVHIKLDAAALGKIVSAAATAFISAKSGDDIAKSRATLTQYQPLMIAAQAVGKNSIYYNAILNTYLLLYNDRNGKRYIDLINGNEYDEAGYPYIERIPTYQSGNQLFALFPNTGDSYTALYSPDGIKLYRCAETKQTSGTIKGSEASRSEFFNVDFGNVISYYDSKADVYTIYKQEAGNTNDSPQKLGEFKPNGSFYTALQYVQSGAQESAAFNADDAASNGQLALLYKGTGQLNIQKIVNEKELVAIDASGKGTSTDGAVQVVINTKQYTNAIKGTYAHYTANGKQYDYVPVYSFLDPVVPVKTCKASAEFTHLLYWKQCTWKMNAVYDTYGILRIVPTLPSRLASIDAQTIQQLLNDAPKNRTAMVNTNVARVLYDRAGNRYVYQVVAEDAQKDFARGIAAGSYIDLYSGIVYAPTDLGTSGAYPQRGLLRSALLLLLNELEFSVAPVQDAAGSPLFDPYGTPLIDAKTKQQLRGRLGLVYRGQSYVDDELKRINNQLSFTQRGTAPAAPTKQTPEQPVQTKQPTRQGPVKIDTKNLPSSSKPPLSQFPQGAETAPSAHNALRNSIRTIAMRKQPMRLAAHKKGAGLKQKV
ncbi:MAG: hypothetical protein WCE21_02645 [Candidatus Babeliales bacterium]